MDKSLSDALAKFGLQGKIGRITFDETHFSTKIEVSTGNDRENEFVKYAKHYNLEPEWFGKSITLKDGEYKIVGLDQRRSKYPVILQNVATGVECGYTEDGIRIQLGNKDAVLAERLKQEVDTARTAYVWGASDLKLNLAWLGQTITVGSEKYSIEGLKSGKKPRILLLLERDKTLSTAPVDNFLSVLGNVVNHHVLLMPPMALRDYIGKEQKGAVADDQFQLR